MNNKRFYIISGIILAVVLGLAVLLDASSGSASPPVQDDQGIHF